MKQRKLWLSAILVCIGLTGLAQGFVENALLFSRTKPGGSARIQAMGGSQIALGGDYSSALSNPAGLGMYNRSEFTFSPALSFYNTESEHQGTKENYSSSVFNIPGLSLVYHYPKEKGKFLGGSFAVSMTRVNDFNSEYQFGGTDNVSSITDYFVENANDDYFDEPTTLAYNNYLLEDSSYFGGSEFAYFSVLGLYDPNGTRDLSRSTKVKTQGAQYQWSFAYGGNYDDKLFFGASVGVTSLRYSFKAVYKEYIYNFNVDPQYIPYNPLGTPPNPYNPLNGLELEENISIDGSGVNLTLGLIYRPVDFMQVGVSLVTPTYYQITDSYTAKIKTDWNNYDYLGEGDVPLDLLESKSEEPILSEYNLTTPTKFSSGATFFLGKYGFVTGDIECINYGKATYKSDISGIAFNEDNADINYYYTNVVNYRLGAELRYEIYRVRGGYNVQNNPYKKDFNVDRSIKTISLGAGIKLNRIAIDFAWLSAKGKGAFSPYVMQNGEGPKANLSNKVSTGMITLGYSF